jgi:hypothetical protein
MVWIESVVKFVEELIKLSLENMRSLKEFVAVN